jgi:Tfp pilus assembly protein PilO
MTGADLIASFKKHPVGFSSGLLCLVLGTLLYIRSDKIAEGQTTYTAKSAEAANIIANVRNSENLPKQVAEMQALSKEMDSRLIRPGQLAVNLQYFYKLEAENEVKLVDIRQGNPPKNAKSMYVGIPYSVSVQGSFKQLVTFLRKLEAGPHFCHFSNVSFTKSGGSTVDSAGVVAESMTIVLNLELLGLP